MAKMDRSMARLNLKITSIWPFLANTGLLTILFVITLALKNTGQPMEGSLLRLAVEMTTPILFAVQAAYILGPDNEPALELLASSPKTMPRLFIERLALIGGLQALVSLVFTCLFVTTLHANNLGLSILHWSVDAIFLGGLAAFTTQLTRQGVFGTLITTLYWGAGLMGGTAILNRWRWFWPFHIYLRPETLGLGPFLWNRLILAAVGVALFYLAARFLDDSDRLLGMR